MPFALVENNRYIELDYLRAIDIISLAEWLKNHSKEREVVKHLEISCDTSYSPRRRISLCILHTLVGLLPRLQGIYLSGLILVFCDIWNHDPGDHTPPPVALHLTNITLERIATSTPFEVDPLRILYIAPHLEGLSIASCHALSPEHAGRPASASPDHHHPHVDFPPLPPFPPSFTSLKVTFPDRDERQFYRMTEDWYDFTLRLPDVRGTRVMNLENVHDDVAPAVAMLVGGDSATLNELRMEFEPGFQKSLPETWAALTFVNCQELRKVVFRLPITRISDRLAGPLCQLAFVGLLAIARKLPPTVEEVRVELVMLDEDQIVMYQAIWAVPWGDFDVLLYEALPSTVLDIAVWGTCTTPSLGALRTDFHKAMPRTARRGKLSIHPSGHPFLED